MTLSLADVIVAVSGEPLPESHVERLDLYGLGYCGRCGCKSTLLKDDYICVHCRYEDLDIDPEPLILTWSL